MVFLQPFQNIYWQLFVHLSQNWGSDSHLGCLKLVQTYWQKMQNAKNKMQKTQMRIHLAPQNDQLNLSFVKDECIVGKKIWSEMVVKWPFMIQFHFESVYVHWLSTAGFTIVKRTLVGPKPSPWFSTLSCFACLFLHMSVNGIGNQSKYLNNGLIRLKFILENY